MSNITTINPVSSASSEIVNEAAYIIVVSLGVLIVILTIALSCYLFRTHLSSLSTSQLSRQRASPIAIAAAPEQAAGLDERVLSTYPKLLYSQVKKRNSGSDPTAGSSCCPICLADYKDDEILLLLPDCAHFFHLNCVDPWLRVRPTCPVCRNSPIRVSPLVPTTRLPIPEGSGVRQNFVSVDVV